METSDSELDILEVTVVTNGSEEYIETGQVRDTEDESDKSDSDGEVVYFPDDEGPLSEGDLCPSDFTSVPPTSTASSRPPSPTVFDQGMEDTPYSKSVGEEACEQGAKATEQGESPCQGKDESSGHKRNHGYAERDGSSVVRQGAKAPDGEMGVEKARNFRPKRARALQGEDERARTSKKSKTATVGPMDLYLRPRERSKEEEQGRAPNVTPLPTGVNDDSPESSFTLEEEERWTNEEDAHPPKKDANHKVTRQGHSARHAKKMREARLSGTQVVNEKLYDRNVRRPALELDANARFDRNNWLVRHSRCGQWIDLRSLYALGRFTEHALECDQTPILDDFLGAPANLRLSSTPPEPDDPPQESLSKLPSNLVERACTGFTAVHNPRVATYLNRPTALGGGGRSITDLAEEKFGKLYSLLTDEQKQEIDRLHQASWRWTINHRLHAVFSTSCKKTVSVPANCNEKQRICDSCLWLPHIKVFRNAIRLDEPELENMVYVTRAYQHKVVGSKFLKIHGVPEMMNAEVSGSWNETGAFFFLIHLTGQGIHSGLSFCESGGKRPIQEEEPYSLHGTLGDGTGPHGTGGTGQGDDKLQISASFFRVHCECLHGFSANI